MIYIQYEADDHTLFTGHVRLADNSFDHAHGTETRHDFEVEDFAVHSYIRGIPHNITESLSGKVLANYKEEFLEYARSFNARSA